MRLPHNGLVETVVRYVRSGKWKELKNGKDRSIYDYLCKNLERREQMLARIRINKELGDETPPELAVVKREGQLNYYLVRHVATGNQGYVTELGDDTAKVSWFATDESPSQESVVSFDEIQFVRDSSAGQPYAPQWNVGDPVRMKQNDEKTGKISSVEDNYDADGTRNLLYHVQWDDNTPASIHTEQELAPIWRKNRSWTIDGYFSVGDDVFDSRYKIKGKVDDVTADVLRVDYSPLETINGDGTVVYTAGELQWVKKVNPEQRDAEFETSLPSHWPDGGIVGTRRVGPPILGNGGEIMHETQILSQSLNDKYKDAKMLLSELVLLQDYQSEIKSLEGRYVVRKRDYEHAGESPIKLEEMIGRVIASTDEAQVRNSETNGRTLYIQLLNGDEISDSEYWWRLATPQEIASIRKRFEGVDPIQPVPSEFQPGDWFKSAVDDEIYRVEKILAGGSLYGVRRHSPDSKYMTGTVVDPDDAERITEEHEMSWMSRGKYIFNSGTKTFEKIEDINETILVTTVMAPGTDIDGKQSAIDTAESDAVSMTEEDIRSIWDSAEFNVGENVMGDFGYGVVKNNKIGNGSATGEVIPAYLIEVSDNKGYLFFVDATYPMMKSDSFYQEGKKIYTKHGIATLISGIRTTRDDENKLQQSVRVKLKDGTVHSFPMSSASEFEPLISDLVSEIGGLEQFINRRVKISNKTLRIRTEEGIESESPYLTSSIFGFLTDAKINEKTNTIDVRIEHAAPTGRQEDVSVFPMIWDSFSKLIMKVPQQMRDEYYHEVVSGQDPSEYLTNDEEHVVTAPNSVIPKDYFPDEDGTFPIEKFVDFVMQEKGEKYEALIALNLDAAAKSFDSVLRHNALRNGSKWLMFEAAIANGHMDRDDLPRITNELTLVRHKMFDYLNSGVLFELYKRSQYKTQFAAALDYNIYQDTGHKYLNDEEPSRAKIAAMQNILQQPDTFGLLKKLVKVNDLGLMEFSPLLRISRDGSKGFINNNQRALIGTLISAASRVQQGAALKVAADQIPGDVPAPVKLKALINTMIGYQVDSEGQLVRGEDGKAVWAVDEEGRSLLPTPEEQRSKDDNDVTRRLSESLRRLGMSFDDEGQPIGNRIRNLTSKYQIGNAVLSEWIDKIRENSRDKGTFSASIFAALKDDEFGTPLEDLIAEAAQINRKEVWKLFTNGSQSVEGDTAARAYIKGYLDYNQAHWVSQSQSFDESLIQVVSQETGINASEIARKIMRNEVIGVQAFDEVMDDEKVKQLLAVPSVITSMTKEETKKAVEDGLYDNVYLSRQSLQTPNMVSVISKYKAKVMDFVAENGVENVSDVMSQITQPQIKEEVQKSWQSAVSVDVLREMSIMRLPYAERQEKMAAIRDNLLTKVAGYPDEYAWVQESYNKLSPMNIVFAPDGNVYKGLFRVFDEATTEKADKLIKANVVGVGVEEMKYRVNAATGGKNIARAAKHALELIHDSLDDEKQKKALNALYIAFTGDAQGGGNINGDLRTVYRQLSENGFVTDDVAKAFVDVLPEAFIQFAETKAMSVVNQSVATWMAMASDEEVKKMYRSINDESISKIQHAMEKELLQQSLERLKGKFKTPKKDEKGQIISGDDGKPEMEVSFTHFNKPKQFYTALQKSGLVLEGEETVESKTQKVLSEMGVSPNWTQFKGESNADSRVLFDQLERVEKGNLIDDFLMRMFTPTTAGDESLFASMQAIRDLANKDADGIHDMRVQINNMMTAMFMSSIVPPRSDNHQDGIAGFWPFETIVEHEKRGGTKSEVIGTEWDVQHRIDWKQFFDNFDEFYAHLPEEDRSRKRKVFETASKIDMDINRHGRSPWVIFEVFDVDYRDDKGNLQTVRKVATREIQYDGLQTYLKMTEHKPVEKMEAGDQILVYDQQEIAARIKKYDELVAEAESSDVSEERIKKIEDEMHVLSRTPSLRQVEVKVDGNNRYYEQDGERIYLKATAGAREDQSLLQEVRLRGESGQANRPHDYAKRRGIVERRRLTEFEQEVYDELTKVYNLIYRTLVKAAKATGADEVLVMPSWTAKMKPHLKNNTLDTPPVDTAIRDDFLTAGQEFYDDKHPKAGDPVLDDFGNEVWSSSKVSQPLKDGYDNTPKQWGFTLDYLDHFLATDPMWGYGRQQILSHMWKLDLSGKSKNSREQIKRMNKRDAKRRRGLVTAQHSEAGTSLAAFMQTYFEIQYRSGEIDFNRFAETLRDAYIQWRDMAAHQRYVQNPQVLEDAKRAASMDLGIDLTGIDSPEWAYQQIDQEAYDRLLERAQAPIEGVDERPQPKEMAEKLDKVLTAIMPNMYSHPEYSHLDSLDVPTAVARDVLLYDHVNFPQRAVRDDPVYRRQILDLVTAFEIRQDEVTDTGVETTWQDVVPDDGGIAGGNVSQAAFYANEAATYMNTKRDDGYDAFTRWMDAEAPELHANDALRSEVEQELRNRGKLSRISSEIDVPSADELEQMFRNDIREASSEFKKGDKVVVRYCVVPQVRCQALARKQARAKVYAVTNAGYVLEFDDNYDQKVLNRQLWLFTDLHLQPASGVSNG